MPHLSSFLSPVCLTSIFYYSVLVSGYYSCLCDLSLWICGLCERVSEYMQKNARGTSADTCMAMTHVAAIYLESAGSCFLSNLVPCLSFTFSPTALPIKGTVSTQDGSKSSHREALHPALVCWIYTQRCSKCPLWNWPSWRTGGCEPTSPPQLMAKPQQHLAAFCGTLGGKKEVK